VTRRRVTEFDGTRHVTAVLALDQLMSVLRTLPTVEAEIVTLRYGLRDGIPRSRAETAAILDLSVADVLRREADAFRLMRHPSRSWVLRDYAGSDLATVPDPVRARIMGEAAAPPVGRCERHGYFGLVTGAILCEVCPCPITPTSDLGRPRRHCSDACRQASYRARKGKPVS
jgi:hypothetical protein